MKNTVSKTLSVIGHKFVVEHAGVILGIFSSKNKACVCCKENRGSVTRVMPVYA